MFRAQLVPIHCLPSHARGLLHKPVGVSEDLLPQPRVINELLSAVCVGKCFLNHGVITAKSIGTTVGCGSICIPDSESQRSEPRSPDSATVNIMMLHYKNESDELVT